MFTKKDRRNIEQLAEIANKQAKISLSDQAISENLLKMIDLQNERLTMIEASLKSMQSTHEWMRSELEHIREAVKAIDLRTSMLMEEEFEDLPNDESGFITKICYME